MSEDIIKEIKNSINKNGKKVLWYDTNGKLLVFGETKSETNKLIRKQKLKDDINLIRLVIEFHSGKKLGQGGKICIQVKTYTVHDKKPKFDNSWKPKSNGIIWFDDKFLEDYGWKNYYLTNIINKLNNDKLKFSFGIFLYKRLE
jgi:hypothetical protein